MTRSDYLRKSYTLLADTETYKLITKDPTQTIQNKLNKTIESYIKLSIFTKETGLKLKCSNGVFPKMYFQPKIHKDDVPLRPIVSYVGSPLYNLSKYLATLLKHAYVIDDTHTKNSFEFVTFIQNFKVPDNYVLLSLDVISLFTNIPTDLTTDIIKEKWHLIQDNTKLSKEQFLELLDFTFKNSYFNFDNKFYNQIYGLGMGNCLSPICSDIVMAELQENCIKKLPFQLPFFKRYVDDIITCAPSDQLQTLLKTFNAFHPKLQFTIEKEKNNSIPFLDILLIRTDNTIITDWYHKPTFSERFLNFHSQHPFQHKANIIKNLQNRAIKLSHPKFHTKNLESIKIYLTKNSYPQKLINKLLKKQITNNSSDHSNCKYYKIPYIKGLSETVSRLLESDTVKIAYKPENTLKKYFTQLKTKTPIDYQSNVIYKIPCQNCNCCYIGQTGRYLRTRLLEHQRSVRPQNLLQSKQKTALAEHSETLVHTFDFTNTKIIGKQQNLKKRLIHEMIAIKKEVHHVNKKEDIEGLNSCYFNIFLKHKTMISNQDRHPP